MEQTGTVTLADIVTRHLHVATAALEAATVHRPLCRIGDGPTVERPKFAEGGLAALTEVSDAVRRRPAEVREVVDEVLARWEQEHLSCADHGGPQVAYLNGGVAGLRSLHDDLDVR